MPVTMSIAEAMAALGLTKGGIEHHLYKTKRLRRAGRGRVTRTSVEALLRRPVQIGRPSKRRSRVSLAGQPRAILALRLRNEGRTLVEIAKALGYADDSSVSRAIRRVTPGK